MPPSIYLDIDTVKKLYYKSVSVSLYSIVNNGFAFGAIDLDFPDFDLEDISLFELKSFDKLLRNRNEELNVFLTFSGLGLKFDGFGFELAHFDHHKLVSDCSLKTLPLLTEVFSIKVYKLVSVSTYLVRK